MSYDAGREEECLKQIDEQIEVIEVLRQELAAENRVLDPNQSRLATRLLLLGGNVCFVLSKYKEARMRYMQANEGDPDNYYALASIGQCEKNLGNDEAARRNFRKALMAIDESKEIERKREVVTRAVIMVLACECALAAGDTGVAIRWREEARGMLERKLAFNGMEPRFFSPKKKRLVFAGELLQECT